MHQDQVRTEQTDPLAVESRSESVRTRPWIRLLGLVSSAIAIGGVAVWIGIGTSARTWIGTVMIVVAAALGGCALFLRARLRRSSTPAKETAQRFD